MQLSRTIHWLRNQWRALNFRKQLRYGDWIITRSGKKFYTLDPRPEDMLIEDIAEALAKKCRYEGHCDGFYSVAEHCCWGAYAAPPKYKLAFLMHDATEAYIPDIARPTKRGWGKVIKQTEEAIAKCIEERFAIPDLHHPIVKVIDNRMLATERACIVTGPEWDKEEYHNPYAFRVHRWDWWSAKRNFLEYYKYLTGQTNECPQFALQDHNGLVQFSHDQDIDRLARLGLLAGGGNLKGWGALRPF